MLACRSYYVNYRTFPRRWRPSCSDYGDDMLFLAECIHIWAWLWENRPQLICIHCLQNPYDEINKGKWFILGLILSKINAFQLVWIQFCVSFIGIQNKKISLVSKYSYILTFSLEGDFLRAWLIFTTWQAKFYSRNILERVFFTIIVVFVLLRNVCPIYKYFDIKAFYITKF